MTYKELMEQVDNEIVKYYGSSKLKDYYISFMGNVIRVNRATKEVNDKYEIPLNENGYKTISVNGKSAFVHRIVATLFIQNEHPEHHNIVHHKNSIRTDNRVSNLQWVSTTLHQDIHREEKACKYKDAGNLYSYENDLWDKFRDTEPVEKDIWAEQDIKWSEPTNYDEFYNEYHSKLSDPSYLI